MPSPAEFSPFDPLLAADPQAYWADITTGLRFLPAGRRAVAVWRHSDVTSLLCSGTHKCPERALATMPPGPFRSHNAATMAFLDPPHHGPVRHAVARAFAPAALARLEQRIDVMSCDLIDALPRSADLVADYAEQLPLGVIAEILGVEAADTSCLRSAAHVVVAGLEPGATGTAIAAADAAITELSEFLAPQLKAPRPYSVFAALADSGLSFDAMLHNAIFLLNAGHETTTRLIAGIGRALIAKPDLWPIAGLVEEVLRLDPPLPFIPRFLAEAWEGHAADTPVVLLIAAANRDPDVFSNPALLDPARTNAAKHLSFAAGRHFCLGATLARMEARIAARHLSEIAHSLALAPGAARTAGRMFQGWATLPIVRVT